MDRKRCVGVFTAEDTEDTEVWEDGRWGDLAMSTQPQSTYWEQRYQSEGMIWGEMASTTAGIAFEWFKQNGVGSILVPGSGYGRNTRLFSDAGMRVCGVEISGTALEIARTYDPKTAHHHGSVLDISAVEGAFDAVYSFNVLHLFRREDRLTYIDQCLSKLKSGGLIYLCVFSEEEETCGKGAEIEPGTFESKPGRPVHYFSDKDLREHMHGFEVIASGIVEDHEDHGEGPHTHRLRYVMGRRK